MNRQQFLQLLLLSLITIPGSLYSQTLYSNKMGKAMIRADSSCKSALVTNFSPTRGDRSQLLATAFFSEGDSLMECRSYIQFNFDKLPPDLKAEHITSARLVLFPMIIAEEGGSLQQPAALEIQVKRISSPWEDSLISWEAQPGSDERSEVSKRIPARKMDHAIDILVTKQVKKMLREGNFGFLVSSTGINEENKQEMNWFGSARHQVKDFRPVLLLEYIDPDKNAQFIQTGTPFVGVRMEELDDAYRRDMQTNRESSRPANSGKPATNGNNPPPPVKSVSKD